MRPAAPLMCAICLILSLANCGGSSSSTNSGTNSGSNSSTGSSQTEILYAAYPTPNGGGAGGYVVPLKINTSTGGLTALNPVLGPGNAFAIAADPSGKFLYTSDFNTGVVYGYAIDSASGNLTPLNGSPYASPASPGGNGGTLTIDPVANFLFYVDTSENIVTFVRNTDGTLTPSSAAVVNDRYQPLSLSVDPLGTFLYAANHSDFNGEQISVFSIDPNTGGLTEIPGSPFAFMQSNSEPWGLAVSNDGNFLFTALSNTAQLAVLSVDRTTGSVSPISGSPFSTAESIPERLILSPSGKYLYVGNASAGSISAFSVNTSSGTLSLVHSPFTTIANWVLAADPSGRYLFSSPNVSSQQGAVWKIDQTGGLSQVSNIPSVNGAATALTSIVLP